MNTVVFEAGAPSATTRIIPALSPPGATVSAPGRRAAWRSPAQAARARPSPSRLLELGAEAIRISSIQTLYGRSACARPRAACAKAGFASIEEAARGCDGVVNCSPLGMDGYPGTAVPRASRAKPGPSTPSIRRWTHSFSPAPKAEASPSWAATSSISIKASSPSRSSPARPADLDGLRRLHLGGAGT